MKCPYCGQDDLEPVAAQRAGGETVSVKCTHCGAEVDPLALTRADAPTGGPARASGARKVGIGLAALVLLGGLWAAMGPRPAEHSRRPAVSRDAPPRAATVHVTETGGKYHRAGCKYLDESDIPMSRKEAEAKGYTPCSICAP